MDFCDVFTRRTICQIIEVFVEGDFTFEEEVFTLLSRGNVLAQGHVALEEPELLLFVGC
jgi:hypothetical protein